jgi:hypothetical protein
MAYQPFLIAPFASGLKLDQSIWLLPQDAFSSIVNGHIHDGNIEKRMGYVEFGKMPHATVITGASNANPAVFTVTTIGVIADGMTVRLVGLAGGTWSTLNDAEYTVDNVVGATFTLIDSNGNPVSGALLGVYTASSGTLYFYPKYRIMGIFRYIDAQNVRDTLIADTKRVAIYEFTSGVFEPLSVHNTFGTNFPEDDYLASTDLDYIWAANWQSPNVNNRVYFTNGKPYTGVVPPVNVLATDGILFYDNVGTYVTQFIPALDTGNTRFLVGCKCIFAIRNRLLVLFTYENANTHPQRARWCAFQNPSNWDDETPGGGGFVDAPTGEQIISAQQLQDMIIVLFTNSVWVLKTTSDPALPFRWEQINAFRACNGKMATIGYDRYVVASGQRGITASDATQTERIDQNIKQFVNEEINGDEFGKVFFARDYQFNRTWMLYPQTESDDSDAVLIFDEDTKSYSTYLYSYQDTEIGNITASIVDLNVIGYGQSNEDLTAPDIIAPKYHMPDDVTEDADATSFGEETALSFFWSKDNELFLAGNRAGTIYELQNTNTDNTYPITFELQSAGWNPFKDNAECQMGYIDIYVDSSYNTELFIEFFTDDNPNPYSSQIIDCLPNLYFLSSITDIYLTDAGDPTQGLTIQAPNHGLENDQIIYMYGINGLTMLNNNEYYVTVTAGDLNTFTIDIDATGFPSYTGGGNIYRNKFYRTKCWKRAYAGGIGYLHYVKITSSSIDEPLVILAMKPYFRPRGKRILG